MFEDINSIDLSGMCSKACKYDALPKAGSIFCWTSSGSINNYIIIIWERHSVFHVELQSYIPSNNCQYDTWYRCSLLYSINFVVKSLSVFKNCNKWRCVWGAEAKCFSLQAFVSYGMLHWCNLHCRLILHNALNYKNYTVNTFLSKWNINN